MEERMGLRIRAISNIKPPLPDFAGEAVFCFVVMT
jgi:hypothetical protein